MPSADAEAILRTGLTSPDTLLFPFRSRRQAGLGEFRQRIEAGPRLRFGLSQTTGDRNRDAASFTVRRDARAGSCPWHVEIEPAPRYTARALMPGV